MKKAFLFIILFLLFFSGAFSMYFFGDDFYFLKRSIISSPSQFFNFFSPFRGTFYRPVSSELFYWILHFVGLYIGKILVFAVFLVGVYFLYRTLSRLTNKTLSVIAIILYTFHFSHVFQLYWFATFQEVALFAALALSFYSFLERKYAISAVSFFIALLCKEQAVLYPAFLLIFIFLEQSKHKKRSDILFILGGFVLSALFIPLYLAAMKSTVALPEYRLQLSPRLIFNNIVWYSLWSLGFPSMMSDYMISLFRLPMPQFYRFFQNPLFTAYFILMFCFLIAMALVALYVLIHRKHHPHVKRIALLAVGFILFLSPTLPIFHKWMVRLTLPLIFVSVAEAAILAFLFKSITGKKILYGILSLYLLFNFLGVKVHEDISTYKLETRIARNAKYLFAHSKDSILKTGKVIITDDSGKELSSWAGVDKLKITFAGQNAAAYYFPNNNISLVYVDKGKSVSGDGLTIPASLFFR